MPRSTACTPSCTWRAARRATTRRPAPLVRAASHADVRHLVYISVVGADSVPLAWLRTKLDSERAIADSGIAWTVLRAAQFHELTLTMIEKMTKLPVLPVPGGLRLQPVDSREVAARLAELTLAAPAGRVPDMTGPEVHDLAAPGPPVPRPARPAPPPDAAGTHPRQGGPRLPRGGEPHAGGGAGGPADVGGVPDGAGGTRDGDG